MPIKLLIFLKDTPTKGMVSKFSATSLDGRFSRITSLTFSDDAEELLVSYASENIYLFNLKVYLTKNIFYTRNWVYVYL